MSMLLYTPWFLQRHELAMTVRNGHADADVDKVYTCMKLAFVAPPNVFVNLADMWDHNWDQSFVRLHAPSRRSLRK